MRTTILCYKVVAHGVSGWPSGLRRQTQEARLFPVMEHSGPQLWAWVRIPLLTCRFAIEIDAKPLSTHYKTRNQSNAQRQQLVERSNRIHRVGCCYVG